MTQELDWKKRISDRLNIQPVIANGLIGNNRELINVLKEFKDLLNKEYMQADLVISNDRYIPKLWSLHTRPRYRLNMENIVFTFAIYPDFIRILGDDCEYHKPSDLQQRLVNFIENSFFSSKIRTYASIFNEDVVGSLQYEMHNGPTNRDIIVQITHDEHNTAAKISEDGGGPFEYHLIKLPTEGFPDFISFKKTEYSYLESSGYFTKIEDVNEKINSDILLLRGNIIATRKRQNVIQ